VSVIGVAVRFQMDGQHHCGPLMLNGRPATEEEAEIIYRAWEHDRQKSIVTLNPVPVTENRG